MVLTYMNIMFNEIYKKYIKINVKIDIIIYEFNVCIKSIINNKDF